MKSGDLFSRNRTIASIDLFKSSAHNRSMKSNAIRTSIDLPRDLHRRVHEAAARKGCSARKLILAGIERAVEEAKVSRPIRRLSLDQPLIRPAGRRISITNEEAYELIELP
jgi:predicted DNA-binding ribbon-helix-helix protein